MSARLKHAAPLVALFLLSLPFLTQAFHIDDTFFLAMADHIRIDWRHPYAFDMNWDFFPEPAFQIMANPPLHSYFLAGVRAVLGEAEWGVHLASFLFVWLAYLGMAQLGRRFGVSPSAAALLTLGTPAALVMSHTVMPDLALMACFVLAVSWFIEGVEDGRWTAFVLAGLCAGAAVLLRYTGIFVVAIWGLYMVLAWDRARRRAGGMLLAAGIMAAMLGAWCWVSWVEHGQLHPIVTMAFTKRAPQATTGSTQFFRVVALLHYVGGTTVFPLSLIVLPWLMGRRGWRWAGYACLAAAIGWGWFVRVGFQCSRGEALLAAGLAAACFVVGACLVAPPLARWRQAPDRQGQFLALWVLLMFASLVPWYFPAVKRILPLVPPLVLLFLRRLQALESGADPRPGIAGFRRATVAATLGLALLVAWADTLQATAHRGAARRLAQDHRSTAGTTYSAGHWGFQYYMERAGLKTLDTAHDRLRPGDVVLIASQPWPQLKVPDLLDLVDQPSGTTMPTGDGGTLTVIAARSRWPIRTVCRPANAHFYSYAHYPGMFVFLPYAVSTKPLEVFLVYRVGAKAPAR